MTASDRGPALVTATPRRLWNIDRHAILRHFLSLGSDDRYLRFGGYRSDGAIEAYVMGIDFASDVVFASDEGLSLAGVAHLARGGRHAELGLSVLANARNRGVGRSLLQRSYVHARNWGSRTLFMHCLAANVTIIRLARSLGMKIVSETSDAEAWLELPPPDVWSYVTEMMAACTSQTDYCASLLMAFCQNGTGSATRGPGFPAMPGPTL
jgi:GNAT superfamily N-acetyltransferase